MTDYEVSLYNEKLNQIMAISDGIWSVKNVIFIEMNLNNIQMYRN